jgi:GT2 family glycosyltransferase
LNTVPTISIIIPVFNQKHYVLKTLEALNQQTEPPLEVILVDNHSEEKIEPENFPLSVRIVRLETNRYFAEAVNQGFSLCKGDLILVLNSDVELFPAFLEHMKNAFLKNPEMLCANGILFTPKRKIDSCGLSVGKSLRPRDIRIPNSEKIKGPSGAAFLLRRSLCERLILEEGFLLDPSISFFYTDLDFAFRLQERNIPTWVIPEAQGIHHRGASTPQKKSFFPFRYCQLSPEFQILLRQNRTQFLKKWFRWKKHWKQWPFVMGYSLGCRLLG